MTDSKRTLYVGGLADDVNPNILRSAFSTFGDIVDINLPMDYSTQKHKGFAFIEFQLPEDAADAIDNMDNGEISGRTIRVNLAKPNKYRETANKPVWADDGQQQLQQQHQEQQQSSSSVAVGQEGENTDSQAESKDSSDSEDS